MRYIRRYRSGMLALTDSALARLAIAATAVDPRKRHIWLQAVADQLEPSPRAKKRARWRRWYNNDKAGIAVTRVRYSGRGLANLIVAGWLPAHKEAYTDAEVSVAITNLLETGEFPRKPNGFG